METLRDLLVQRAARLQERPALSAVGWGTLTWTAWRSRVEGVALGLMSVAVPLGAPIHSATGGPWDWAGEVAAACCGLRWDRSGGPIDPAVLGGPRFNDDRGRGPYHALEQRLEPGTPFLAGGTHGELLTRLRRLNGSLGWDHETRLRIPLAALPTAEARAALWSLLYAGGHAELVDGAAGDWCAAGRFDLLGLT
jgi:hypothetical protein